MLIPFAHHAIQIMKLTKIHLDQPFLNLKTRLNIVNGMVMVVIIMILIIAKKIVVKTTLKKKTV